jgi:hypothetical protein
VGPRWDQPLLSPVPARVSAVPLSVSEHQPHGPLSRLPCRLPRHHAGRTQHRPRRVPNSHG